MSRITRGLGAASLACVLLCAGCNDRADPMRLEAELRDAHSHFPGPQAIPEARVDFAQALGSGWIEAAFAGNGREILRMTARNLTAQDLQVAVPAGLALESDTDQIVVARPAEVRIPRDGQADVVLHSAATRSTNQLGNQRFTPSPSAISELAALFPFLEKHPEVPIPAIQTAVLVIMENLPLSSFARFQLLAGRSAAASENEIFRVDVRHIILALQSLKDMGFPMERVALVVDPQLLIEAMIDPMAYSPARVFYEIPASAEWAFWEEYLVHGPPETRHYALYGIARHYPDVALEMLPRWIRRNNLEPGLRIAAAQSLASTSQLEALSILEQLRLEFAGEAELELALRNSAEVVQQAVYHPFSLLLPVNFRITPPVLAEDRGQSP